MIGRKREYIFDLMRVIAAFFVVMIHVSSEYIFAVPISRTWVIAACYDTLSRFCVPLLFMISGRFMLDPCHNLPLRKLARKTALLLLLYFFWSAVYLLLHRFVFSPGTELSFGAILEELLRDETHLWFLWVIIGLYLCTPVLRALVKSKAAVEWFLLLFIIFQIVIPTLTALPKVGPLLQIVQDSISLKLVLGYTGYYLLGYYLYSFCPSSRKRRALHVIGIVSLFICGIGTVVLSWTNGKPVATWLDYLHPTVFVFSVAVYSVFLQAAERDPDMGSNPVIQALSKCSVGIYLIHFIWLLILRRSPLFLALHPAYGIPALTVVFFQLSFLTALLIRRIPFTGKLLA